MKHTITRFNTKNRPYANLLAMSKTTRKGIKVKIPSILEGWYEQTIEGLRKKKDTNQSEVDFEKFLLIMERDIESQLWSARFWVLKRIYDKEIDADFSLIFSNFLCVFNEMRKRFDPSTLSDDLLIHLQQQIKTVLTRFENLNELAIKDIPNEQLLKEVKESLRLLSFEADEMSWQIKTYYKEKKI